MKKNILSIILVATIACVTILPSTYAEDVDNEAQYEITESYEYPIKPGDDEWYEFTSLQEKIEACAIPKEVLSSMTTEALVKTILDYPLLANVYAYENYITGFESVKSYFPGVEELLSREDAQECLVKYRSMRSDGFSYYVRDLLNYVEINQTEGNLLTSLTDVDPRFVTFFLTPNGTEVTVMGDVTWNAPTNPTEEEAEQQLEELMDIYPNATLISDIDPSYNCHSYAFLQSAGVSNYERWNLPNPVAYMEDGSFTECSPYVGAVIYYHAVRDYGDESTEQYGGYRHSGLVERRASGGQPMLVSSKWGWSGLFEHYVDDCPYVGYDMEGHVIPVSMTNDFWELA